MKLAHKLVNTYNDNCNQQHKIGFDIFVNIS